MPLQRFTMGRMLGLAKVVCSTISLLRFPGVVVVPQPLLHHVSLAESLRQFSTHPSKAFHTRHVAAPVVLCHLLLRLGP
jgi:hypothetical protein